MATFIPHDPVYTAAQKKDLMGEAGAWNLNPALNAAYQTMWTDPALVTTGDKYNATAGYGQKLQQDAAADSAANNWNPTNKNGNGGYGAADAIKALWAFYNKKPTNTVNTVAPLRQLIQGIKAQQNPYQNVAMPSLAGATNPLAAYMQQGGADPAAAQQMQQMLAAESAGVQQADRAMQQQMGQAWKANQQAMINQARQQRQLGVQQQAAMQQQVNSDAMMGILKMAIENGVDLGKLGISF